MPILVKDYNWSETLDTVTINVPLKGVNSKKADIFCSDEFIKVNFPPFLFEALLFAEIEEERSTAKIRDGLITFTLKKRESCLWEQLLSVYKDDKAYVLKKKQEAIDRVQQRNVEIGKEKLKLKDQTKKFALKKMMQLEESDRSRIATIKESEREKVTAELNSWKDVKMQENIEERIRLVDELAKAKLAAVDKENNDSSTDIFSHDEVAELPESCITELSSDDDEDMLQAIEEKKKYSSNTESDLQKDEQLKKKQSSLSRAGPRKTGNIQINFTPRSFPTPQRESKLPEETEWLKKQAKARKQMEIDDPDLALHEKDPVWLKDKGNSLFASENFLGAINAYNLAIRIQPGMPILYLNRAACHLKLRNLYKAAEDCGTALELMVPAVEANAKGRLKGHLRRAAAYCELELYVEALQDYEAALKIAPNNEKIKQDAKSIREVIQNEKPS